MAQIENNKHETALTIPQIMQLGEVLFKSGYFADVKSAAQATVKVLRGQELGIGPVTALEQVHVIQGRTALSAGLIGALIKRSGRYDYRIVAQSNEKCEIVFIENGQEVGRSIFTIQDAQRAGLLRRDQWQQYPRNMLFARALSNGARWFCPDVFGGAVYTPEELQTIDIQPVETPTEVFETPTEDQGGNTPVPLASERQRKMFFAVAKKAGYADAELRELVRAVTGKDNSKDVTAPDMSMLIDAVQGKLPSEQEHNVRTLIKAHIADKVKSWAENQGHDPQAARELAFVHINGGYEDAALKQLLDLAVNPAPIVAAVAAELAAMQSAKEAIPAWEDVPEIPYDQDEEGPNPA